ncbi:hypothetical protein [Xenorhabdus bovienii]|nr:hypothetical protein [Xenorhabdus bovienii]MDE9539350.1 hypothetical protein [Xenorhabdus bovienii]
MKKTNYVATYLADYPCGHRHFLRISMAANDAIEAIGKSQAVLSTFL